MRVEGTGLIENQHRGYLVNEDHENSGRLCIAASMEKKVISIHVITYRAFGRHVLLIPPCFFVHCFFATILAIHRYFAINPVPSIFAVNYSPSRLHHHFLVLAFSFNHCSGVMQST
jgi:hypothetical protein